MGRNFLSKAYFQVFFRKSLPNLGQFYMNICKNSQNRGKFLIAGKCMGPIYSKFGKCMGQFSFSQRHIPTKKNREYLPPGILYHGCVNLDNTSYVVSAIFN